MPAHKGGTSDLYNYLTTNYSEYELEQFRLLANLYLNLENKGVHLDIKVSFHSNSF